MTVRHEGERSKCSVKGQLRSNKQVFTVQPVNEDNPQDIEKYYISSAAKQLIRYLTINNRHKLYKI